MILTITLNPAIDISYRLDTLVTDGTNRCSHVIKTAGGKGLNVTRVLHCIEGNVCATGLLGGANGQFIVNQLNQLGISNDFVSITGETRNCIAILHDGKQTEILEGGPRISEDEKVAFLCKYEELLHEADLIVASGSIPKDLGNGLYCTLIEKAHQAGRRFLLDSSGEALRKAIPAVPYLIKPNREELAQLLGKKIESREDVIAGLEQLKDTGITCIVVSLGAEGALALYDRKIYHVEPAKIEAVNATGSGDSTMAGFAYALENGFPVEKMLTFGCVLGTLNAMEEQTGFLNKELIEDFLARTTVQILKEL
ncbi:1-phosphofructokinase [Aneurinibacillus terranovensis]|uniref:1-phosphofructokinase n=1 Tax=Aneurinibacillus terranovensis TaxID=278991 RepID=UPI0004277754|nr:1-phosphofructokinase [Aneurinibacillus terranovensis]